VCPPRPCAPAAEAEGGLLHPNLSIEGDRDTGEGEEGIGDVTAPWCWVAGKRDPIERAFGPARMGDL
jgi:hypothetical protein